MKLYKFQYIIKKFENESVLKKTIVYKALLFNKVHVLDSEALLLGSALSLGALFKAMKIATTINISGGGMIFDALFPSFSPQKILATIVSLKEC